MFWRAPLAEIVTAPGKVLVNPWSAPPLGEFTDPGESSVSWAALRPFNGSSVMRACSTTCLMVEVMVSTWGALPSTWIISVSYTHLRAHETPEHLVCRL